jgi:uncharacterized membrane protein YhaH (DUF805 family)
MKKYVDLSGRARRKEYWMFHLFNVIFAIAVVILASIFGTASEEDLVFRVIYGLFALVTILPTLTATVRRLHDVGKSGWWILISIIPLIGDIWLFVLMVTDSQPGDNQYGPNPKMNMA